MKKVCFLILASLILLTSCGSTDYIDIKTSKNQPADAELNVRLAASNLTTQSRSVGYGDNNYVETQITNAVVATFFEDGSLNAMRYATFAEGAEKDITMSLKSGNIIVYVIANVNVDLFETVSKETDLESIILNLDQTITPLTANKTVRIYPKETTVTNIELKRIVSKVSLSKVDVLFYENGYSEATFSIDKVFLHNVNTKSTINCKAYEPKSGLEETSLINYKSDFFGCYDRHFFYAFESDLQLVIGGYFKDGQREAEYLYYPVDVKAISNTHHNVSVVIKGKGVKDPNDKFEASGNLDLTIDILDWDTDNKEYVFE